ncbi:MAG: SIR2 family NAD-dependent protein deacylase [Promethearchaeota archaeon]
MLNQKITSVAQLLLDAQYAIILTGAGISTESGIPDFRGRSGIWKEFNPILYGNIETLKSNPNFFWKLAKRIAPTLLKATPNPGHDALVELEEMGKIRCIITQNIDGLHQQAGSKVVFEVHGSLRNFTCMECEANYTQEEIVPKIFKGIPKCENCGGFLKPNVVLFGDSLPLDQIENSQAAALEADLILVAGSALEVFPVNKLPQVVVNHGGKLVIINDEPTWLDDHAEIVIHEKTGKTLPKIVEELKKLL